MLYLAAVIYLSVLYIRPAEIVPSLETVPLVDWLTIVSTLIMVGTIFVRPRRLSVSAMDGWVLLFWVAIVVSNLAWGWFGGAYMGFTEFAPVVFFYLLVRVAIDTPERLRGFAHVFVFLNVLLAINGIVQYHTGVGIGNVTTVGLENRIRGTGIFNDPNDLGMTLVMAVPLLLWVVFESARPLWHRVLAIVLSAPIVTAIAYTSSRGAMLGLCAVAMVFALRRFRMIPALTFGAVAVSGVMLLGGTRAQAMTSQENSAQSRIEAWGQGLMMLKSKPVFGVGYGRFTEFHNKVAHNSFIQTAAELGLFGALIFIARYDTLFRILNRGRKGAAALAPTLSPSWMNAMIAAGAGMLVCGFFLSRQYVAVPFILLAMAGSIDGLVPKASGGTMPPFLWSGTRAVGLFFATLGAVYVMVLTMGAW
ncbi:MAG TPA: O-antigen ligase family protein [Vicinamibacterales bacterium]|nr:O-antigen ligase family protein [Vicinamibacterales bacterium]